jgi:iron complex transport system ATP-binding protein
VSELSTEALGIATPDGRWLVRELQTTMPAGRTTVIVGPNGSGKSSLLRHLVGLAQPQRGCVRLDGRPLQDWPARARAQRIAYLPQRTPLYHDVTLQQLVMLGRAPHLPRLAGPRPEDRRAVRQAMDRVGVTTLAHRRVSTLSGGEQQRGMLARMLATEADVLVLDEPTTALDVGHALAFVELCRAQAEAGRAVVMALHEIELARRYGDAAICLDAGDGHWEGPVRDVLTPEVLEPVFDVRARIVDETLHFSPRPDPRARVARGSDSG